MSLVGAEGGVKNKAQCLWNIIALKSWKTLQERRMVSHWKQSCLLSELSDRWCLSVEKRWEHVGDQFHTPLCRVELVGGGRHESVRISCTCRDRGNVQL